MGRFFGLRRVACRPEAFRSCGMADRRHPGDDRAQLQFGRGAEGRGGVRPAIIAIGTPEEAEGRSDSGPGEESMRRTLNRFAGRRGVTAILALVAAALAGSAAEAADPPFRYVRAKA